MGDNRVPFYTLSPTSYAYGGHWAQALGSGLRQLAAADETDWQTVRPRTTHAKPRRKPQPEHNTREEGHFEAAFWEHAKTKASRKTLVTKPNRERFNNDGTHTRRQQEYDENNAPCYYCAEPSHKTRDC